MWGKDKPSYCMMQLISVSPCNKQDRTKFTNKPFLQIYSGTENDQHTFTQQTEAHCHENVKNMILFTFQLKRTKITLAAHQCTKKTPDNFKA